MTEKQHKDLLTAVQGIARALGADLVPDKDPKEQYDRGLAFILGRLLGNHTLTLPKVDNRCAAREAAQVLAGAFALPLLAVAPKHRPGNRSRVKRQSRSGTD